MPEFVSPGVYVEEVSFRPKSIEGVATSVAGFIGPSVAGPTRGPARLVTSIAEFEAEFGPSRDLHFSGEGGPTPNDLALGVRAYFANGGKRAFVVRVHVPGDAVDGVRPDAMAYRGRVEGEHASGLLALEPVEDVSIIVAPGVARDTRGGGESRRAVHRELIAHCEKMRDRLVILDGGEGQSASEIARERDGLDSSRAAMYYPWLQVRTEDGRDRLTPASGLVAGVYARVASERSVYWSPANEIVRFASGPERRVTKSEQDALNPEGINVIRAFEGRGLRVWGARTLSRDSEWKYVSVRRAMTYLECSIDRGTRWAVFEPNGEALWMRVRGVIESFLQSEWRGGGLIGSKPEEAFFVRCDRSTMTQNDIDDGRLVVLVGVALLKPSEFVIFRVGQWTADRRA